MNILILLLMKKDKTIETLKKPKCLYTESFNVKTLKLSVQSGQSNMLYQPCLDSVRMNVE